jgi:hypothetical protein
MSDKRRLPETWQAWHERAETQFRQLADFGLEPIRCILDPVAFAAWCDRHRLKPDQTARRAFCAELLASRQR